MPNGYHGDQLGWQRISAPLKSLDPVLEAFAAKKNLALGKNTRNWPDREIRWSDTLRRLIEIYLADESDLTW